MHIEILLMSHLGMWRLGRWRSWEENKKMDLRKEWCEDQRRIEGAQDRVQ